jgi:histone H3/H4
MARNKQIAAKASAGKASAPYKGVNVGKNAKAKRTLPGGVAPASGAKADGEKKPHRYRPGTVALRNIHKYQKSTDMIIPRAGFMRFLKAMVFEQLSLLGESDQAKAIRCNKNAALSLQTCAEEYLTTLYHDSNLLSIHSKRKTLSAKDIQCIQVLRASNTGAVSVV